MTKTLDYVDTEEISFIDLQDLPKSILADAQSPSLSDEYQFYSTVGIIKLLLSKGWKIFEASAQKSKKPYSKHMVTFYHPDVMTKDGSYINIVLFNGHDGKSALRLYLGILKSFCWNGLIVGSAFEFYRSVHRYTTYTDIEAAIEAFPKKAKNFALFIPKWQDFKLSNKEQEDFAIEAASLRWENPVPYMYKSLLNNIRRQEDAKDDLWTLFNRIQENLLRSYRTIDNKGKRKGIRGISSVSRRLEINTKLFDVAHRMYVKGS